MKCLVTGGAGLIGSAIVDRLLNLGHEVISVDNYVAGKRDNLAKARVSKNFQELELDICDLESMEKIFKNGIDIVFHEAVSKNTVSLIDPQKDLRVNAGGTLGLLQLALKYEIMKFIHASTGSVYGSTQVFPTHENAPKNPTSFYGNSKLAAETYVSLFHDIYNLPTVTLRYFHVYGSRQDGGNYGGVVPIFIKNALQNKPILISGDGSQIRAFTYVEDVARINTLAMEMNGNEGAIYNCASDERISINFLAKSVLELCVETSTEIKFTEPRIGDVLTFDVDNTRLKRDLNFNFDYTFENGLKKTFSEISKLSL
jgi:nucleoside-diphosphate-sugar epimerase